MTTAPRFHPGDRVRTRYPVGLFDANQRGTILQVFFGTELCDVLFDGQAEPRMVVGEKLIEETPLLTREAGAPAASMLTFARVTR
jgi:hypothetical protein